MAVDTGGANPRTLTATTIAAGNVTEVGGDISATFNLSGFIEQNEAVRLTLTAGLIQDSSITPDTTGASTAGVTLTNNSTFVGLAPLADLKAYIGETGTSNDLELARLLRVAASRIEGACGKEPGDFLSQTFTETLNPTGDPSVYLKNGPVSSVTSVTRIFNDGSTEAVASTDYRFDPKTGEVRLIVDEDAQWLYGSRHYQADDWILRSRGFAKGFRSVQVVYVAGYTPTTMPYDLQQAAIEIARELWATRKLNPGLNSESLPDYSYSAATQTERSDTFKNLIQRYRCMVWS